MQPTRRSVRSLASTNHSLRTWSRFDRDGAEGGPRFPVETVAVRVRPRSAVDVGDLNAAARVSLVDAGTKRR